MIIATLILAAVTATPVPITKAQTDQLLAAQAQINQATRDVMAARVVEEAAKQRFQALLNHVALEQKLDLETHEVELEEHKGKYSFKVKVVPTPTPEPMEPTPEPEPKPKKVD